jgi:uncharacterized protein YecE (DUF72 family)
MSLRVGTSGWNYPSGPGKWNGIFYPASRSKRAGTDQFDELRFYAEHFDTVEVNSTFYGQPRAEVTRGWVERTPSAFDFSLKLYQKFTHPKMFKETALKRAPGAAGSLLDLLAQVTHSDIDEFRAGIDPLASAGKLGALLAQFPASFRNTEATRDYLAQVLRAFQGYPVAVELRHRSWSDAIGDTLAMLNECNAAWVQIDEPKFRFSIRQNYLPNIRASTTCGCTGGTRPSGGVTNIATTATTTCIQPRSCGSSRTRWGPRTSSYGSRTSTRTITSARSRWSTPSC